MITRIQLFVDFLRGGGFFKGDPDAWRIARQMSVHKRRNLARCGIVPRDFFLYLAIKDIIQHADVPEKAMTIREFLDFLWGHRYQNEQGRSMGWFLYREILKSYLPSLAGSFGQGDYVWRELQES